MKRKIIVPAVIITGVLAFGSIGVMIASAHDSTTYPPIVRQIAERFGLNEDEVLQVFQDVHSEKRAEAEAKLLTRLDDAVSAGIITQTERDLLFDKYEDLRAQIEDIRTLPFQERQEAMRAIRNDFENWLDEQGFGFGLFLLGDIGKIQPDMKFYNDYLVATP